MDYHGPVTRSRVRKNEPTDNLELRNGKRPRLARFREPTVAVQPGTSHNLRKTSEKRKIVGNVKGENVSTDEDSDNTTGNEELNLLDVLNNLLCRNNLLSFLQINDLLRLRRTCKSSKNMAEDFIRSQKMCTRQKLEIDFRQKNPFSQFNQHKKVVESLPTRSTARFQLSRKEEIPLLTAPLDNLLKWCATNITHLTVSYPLIPFNSELNFLGSFPNLTYLELEDIRYAGTVSLLREPVVESPYTKTKLPANLKHLKSLMIEDAMALWEQINTLRRWHPNTYDVITQLVEDCMQNLELLSFPFGELDRDVQERRELCMSLACMCLFNTTKLKLEYLRGIFIDEILRPNNRTPEMGTLDEMIQVLKGKVVSIFVPQKTVFLHNLPNLEKISFGDISDCSLPAAGFARREWQNLKEIQVEFHNKEGNENLLSNISHRRIWEFLFVGICRENVASLDICFSDVNKKKLMFPATDIPTSCPNLKTLRIGFAISQYINLPELWRRLPRLEKLRIDCDDLKDKDLIGEDVDTPAFWSLKNLKVLEFHVMGETELTDDVFSQVICHMPLRKLTLIGTGPFVSEITLNGIKSMLLGIFATTVERLSIRKLNLPGVTLKQYKKLNNF